MYLLCQLYCVPHERPNCLIQNLQEQLDKMPDDQIDDGKWQMMMTTMPRRKMMRTILMMTMIWMAKRCTRLQPLQWVHQFAKATALNFKCTALHQTWCSVLYNALHCNELQCNSFVAAAAALLLTGSELFLFPWMHQLHQRARRRRCFFNDDDHLES